LEVKDKMKQFIYSVHVRKLIIIKHNAEGSWGHYMFLMMMMMNFIHVSMYLADANWGHNMKIK